MAGGGTSYPSAGNRTLASAKAAKQDEFYTQLADIANELKHYKEHFKGKVVLCNCDDPCESNFFKHFPANFSTLGLKKLVTTSYAGSPIVGGQLPLMVMEGLSSVRLSGREELGVCLRRALDTCRPERCRFGGRSRPWGPSAPVADRQAHLGQQQAVARSLDLALYVAVRYAVGSDKAEARRLAQTGRGLRQGSLGTGLRLGQANSGNVCRPGQQGGDLGSPECDEIMKPADIVVANPPFCLSRERVAQLVTHGKVIGATTREGRIPDGTVRVSAPADPRSPSLSEDNGS
ncbi:MAG: hypothetical protein HONBIEJF_00554 [Fimbriimonadaceae bacterium]|nr:hypothetical protein [Fimbriimonadaceae bacterium]